jgi:hypothetical protein
MPPAMTNVYVKCLGFDDEAARYLNGKSDTNKLELAVRPEPDISGGTEWMIRPWEDNTISFVRVIDGDTRWLEGKADGSVTIS